MLVFVITMSDPFLRRLFVGGVSNQIMPDYLHRLFSKCGEVEEVEVGFAGLAFVLMRTEKGAMAAITNLNNTYPDKGTTKHLSVRLATKRGYESAWQKKNLYESSHGKRAIVSENSYPLRKSQKVASGWLDRLLVTPRSWDDVIAGQTEHARDPWPEERIWERDLTQDERWRRHDGFSVWPWGLCSKVVEELDRASENTGKLYGSEVGYLALCWLSRCTEEQQVEVIHRFVGKDSLKDFRRVEDVTGWLVGIMKCVVLKKGKSKDRRRLQGIIQAEGVDAEKVSRGETIYSRSRSRSRISRERLSNQCPASRCSSGGSLVALGGARAPSPMNKTQSLCPTTRSDSCSSSSSFRSRTTVRRSAEPIRSKTTAPCTRTEDSEIERQTQREDEILDESIQIGRNPRRRDEDAMSQEEEEYPERVKEKISEKATEEMQEKESEKEVARRENDPIDLITAWSKALSILGDTKSTPIDAEEQKDRQTTPLGNQDAGSFTPTQRRDVGRRPQVKLSRNPKSMEGQWQRSSSSERDGEAAHLNSIKDSGSPQLYVDSTGKATTFYSPDFVLRKKSTDVATCSKTSADFTECAIAQSYSAIPTDGPPAPTLAHVGLTFRGKRKLVKHLRGTSVGQLVEMYEERFSTNADLVAVDAEGVEVGPGLCISDLIGTAAVLELSLQENAW